MKSVWYRAVVASAVVVALGAGSALAADEKSKAPTAPGDTYKSPAASSKSEGKDFTGRHTMVGEVTKVDQQKGTLSVKTAEGTMDLHFPPSALANVKKGDRVSVELALKHDMAAGGSPRTESTPKR